MASIGMLESIPEAPSDGREVGMDNPLTATVSGSSALFVERMVILGDAAESLLCKLYELYTMQDYLASGFPKLSELLVKKFPQHPSEINLSKVDKNNLERLLANVEGMLGNLKPWYFCLVDVMEYYKGVLSVLGEANTLLRSSDPALVENLIKSFAQTASDAVRKSCSRRLPESSSCNCTLWLSTSIIAPSPFLASSRGKSPTSTMTSSSSSQGSTL